MENLIKCPHCGKDIEVTEVLTHSIRESMKAELESELVKKEQIFAAQQIAIKAKEKELAAKQESIDEQVDEKLKTERLKIAEQKKTLETQQQQIDEQVAAKVKANIQKVTDDTLKKAREETAQQAAAMQVELEEQRKKNRESQKRELELIKKQQELEDAKESLQLEVVKQVNEQRKIIAQQEAQKAAEQQELKLREKDDLIRQMQDELSSIKHKLEKGSQEAQGEAMEGQLQDKLSQVFPFDIFDEVKKGARGADIIQRVRNSLAKDCGVILWETKNTQAFSKEWLIKLKKDQQESGADIAVLATVTLPREICGFGVIDDVWVTDYPTALCLATALRQGLINVARERVVAANQDSMKDIIYRYITGQEFTMQVKGIVTSFARMKHDLDSEKRSMQRIWKIREKRIETVLGNVTSIYSSIEGYVGDKQLPKIEPLMLESVPENEELS